MRESKPIETPTKQWKDDTDAEARNLLDRRSWRKMLGDRIE